MTDILDRWGLIADYLRVSERTAIRYYTNNSLPVTFDPAGHPKITKEQIDHWKNSALSAKNPPA